MRRLVLPGEHISEKSPMVGHGVIKDKDGAHSSLLGLLDERENFLRIIPLSGKYDPKAEDFIIGVVSDVQSTFWRLDINSPYSAILPGGEFQRELRGNERLKDILPIGSTVYVKIKEVTKSKGVFTTLNWTGTKILKNGMLLEISSPKIPRIIGKKDSMINTIRQGSGCNVLAGQNGLVWISGSSEGMALAAEVVRYIETNSHRSGLTELVKNMLNEKKRS